ncbi:MAG: DEAD/DEAH box helicase [Phycisphaerae bacterium]|nr:DEAD/DEAH box helicase [Phycisphaerae bacterium]MCZ2400826.1 DEAD/DEAH box helicase [Phycisphaerae bacterium]NUQ48363.1 DEAD/DEAH box helicase [Phycisphaerae bacterium]
MDRSGVWEKFLESVPFDLYPFQEEALLAWFESPGGVLVCAPTGMGKTLIAEAAVFEALHTHKRLYYTTPLIALTDQKYRELQESAQRWGFRREDIGLITGNRRENPEAPVRVVVAEILLNHLLAPDAALSDFEHVAAVVMDEFHNFNDAERGIVWELSLVMLPRHVRVMLLSATVGNPYEFSQWLKREHGREVALVTSNERRVPLEFLWVEDRLLSEVLPEMVSSDDAANRTPALVFCFNRDECWELAERLKGLDLIGGPARAQIEEHLNQKRDDLAEGVGPKLRQMLLRGVGVHHAGVLPKHKHIVEELFLRKLVPFVICTETLAAGINLPARSVVLSTLLKGPRTERTLVAPATAHQIFGRAGRPQFDRQGYVYAVAHDDDVKINKWKKRYEQIDPKSKDPGVMRMRKEMERKRPTRRKTETYWTEGQFKSLIAAGPAKLFSRSMIPYQVLVFMLTRTGTLQEVRHFLRRRFTSPDRLEKFEQQLAAMLSNMAALGYLAISDDGDHVTLNDGIHRLLGFRSVDPLYGAFLCELLSRADEREKLLALESVLEVPRSIERKVRIPEGAPGPLETQVLQPMLVSMGIVAAHVAARSDDDENDYDDEPPEDEERPPSFPEMLKLAFDARLVTPEPLPVQPKWVAGAAFEFDCDFYKFVRSAELVKQEGLVLRHLLRLAILAGEFLEFTGDPDYERVGELATRTCHRVDPAYTDRFLADAAAIRKLAQSR